MSKEKEDYIGSPGNSPVKKINSHHASFQIDAAVDFLVHHVLVCALALDVAFAHCDSGVGMSLCKDVNILFHSQSCKAREG